MQCAHTGPWWRSEGGESRAEAESVGEGGAGTAVDTGSRETHHWEREYLEKSRPGNVLGAVEGQVIRLQVDMMMPWSLPWTKSLCGEAGRTPMAGWKAAWHHLGPSWGEAAWRHERTLAWSQEPLLALSLPSF